MYIISFNSTHHSIKADKVLEEKNIKHTTLPTPREISASCGISIRFLEEDLYTIKEILRELDYSGVYHIKVLEGNKKEAKKIF